MKGAVVQRFNESGGTIPRENTMVMADVGATVPLGSGLETRSRSASSREQEMNREVRRIAETARKVFMRILRYCEP